MITPDTVARGGFGLRKRALWDRIRGVDSEEEQQRTTGDPSPPSPATTLCGAALAAELLENACAPGSEDSLRIEVVRTLARDLKVELETLAALADGETGAPQVEVVEGALRAADVANLAACAVPEFPEACLPEAAAAAHLAAGAARALGAFAETSTEDSRECHAPYALRDIRGAVWRARLATRQVDEFLGRMG
jgi:hypothetical protein